MAADIVKTAQRSVGAARDQERLTQQIGSEVVAGVDNLFGPPNNLPCAPEDASLLTFEEIGRDVVMRRQSACALYRGIDSFSEICVDSTSHVRAFQQRMDYIQP